MENTDTIKLLRECDAGTKMGAEAIDDVIDKVKDEELLALLKESRDHHEKLQEDIEHLLDQYGVEEKEPALMAKGMSWLKTNMKLTMEESDATIADLITDGCNMGVKSLFRYQNQYKAANQESVAICQRLIKIEEKLREALRKYL